MQHITPNAVKFWDFYTYQSFLKVFSWTFSMPLSCSSLGLGSCGPTVSRARFLSCAWSKLRLCSANHRPGYWSNLPFDWPSTVWRRRGRQVSSAPAFQHIIGPVLILNLVRHILYMASQLTCCHVWLTRLFWHSVSPVFWQLVGHVYHCMFINVLRNF